MDGMGGMKRERRRERERAMLHVGHKMTKIAWSVLCAAQNSTSNYTLLGRCC